ncbi:MAG: hypothetical protein V7752_08165 [Halopseudomonas sp.]
MRALKFVGKGLLIFLGILFVLFMYFDSDFHEVRRLKDQVEKNLKLSSIELPELIDRETYGWAEEGGDKALLLLSPLACTSISSVMTGSEESNGKSEYSDMFARNKLNPSIVKTWFKSNAHGDFTYYALDEKSCSLYRRYHYE